MPSKSRISVNILHYFATADSSHGATTMASPAPDPQFTHLVAALAGIVLLCLPSVWFFPADRRHLSIDRVLDKKFWKKGFWLAHPVAWIDGARGWAGAALLSHALSVLPPKIIGPGETAGFLAALLMAGVFMQLLHQKTSEGERHAPADYVAGVLLGFFPPGVALPALVLGAASAAAARSMAWGLVVTGFGLGLMGVLLKTPKHLLLGTGTALGILLLLAINTNCRFVISVPRQLIERLLHRDARYISRLR